LDSTPDVAKTAVAKRLIEECKECVFHGQGLLLPAALVASVEKTFNLFVGFDEIWFFNEAPHVLKPADLSIASPLNLEVDDVSAQLVQWMEDSGCELGLGDGTGLNYATPDRWIAKILEEFGRK